MALPAVSLKAVLGLLHQSLSPLRADQSPGPVVPPAPSSLTPQTIHPLHVANPACPLWAGWLCPAFHSEVLSFQVPSSRRFPFSERQDFLSSLQAKRPEIYPPALTSIRLFIHPLSYPPSQYPLHTAFLPSVSIHEPKFCPFFHPFAHHPSVHPTISFLTLEPKHNSTGRDTGTALVGLLNFPKKI